MNIYKQKFQSPCRKPTRLILALSAGLIVSSAMALPLADSTSAYQTQYEKQLNQVFTLDYRYQKLNARINDVNTQIRKLEMNQSPGWFAKRKLTKLTADKAAFNDEIILTFNELSRLKIETTRIFDDYYTNLSQNIDKTLFQLTQTADTSHRQQLSQNLLDLVEKRNRLLSTRRYFQKTDDNLYPEKENLVALIANSSQKNLILKDVINILNDKIHQIDLMISAARTEDQLRKRLTQFNAEMSTLTGEISSHQTAAMSYNTNDRDAKTDASWGSITTNIANTTDYRNWLGNAAQSVTPLPMSEIDYLPLIQKIPTVDLPLYMTQLDSIRKYYQNQLQEVTKIK